ncbi:hypothetical protein HC766_06015 [Candidatus Gracilibacteria bacterium]|nr:hypothetical protein [Candidatus Gracilibacteria bacterium]
METKKTQAEIMLEEFVRRRDAGEFDQLPTEKDLEGLDPDSIKYHLIRCSFDKEYAKKSDREWVESTNSARASAFRFSHGIASKLSVTHITLIHPPLSRWVFFCFM